LGWIEGKYKKHQKNRNIALIVGAATSSEDRDAYVSQLVERVNSLCQDSPAV
jgi:hypothetical protein